MNIEQLHDRLKTAYSNQNLNRITVTLIGLFKEEQFGTLEHIVEMISETVDIAVDADLRYFSKLMMLYHPDRGQYHRMEIDKLAEKNDYESLLNYTHILLLARIEEIAKTLSSFEDIDYSPVYEWDWDTDGFHIVGDTLSAGTEKLHNRNTRVKGLSFYEAFQLRMLGNTSGSFPLHYFEDIEEFELERSGIDDLDGIQYCIHAKTMDLACNAINDISFLWGLKLLEELNLADNKLEIIDALANLQNLRSINLSDNKITDISPLLGLNRLEYVVLSGNRISREQITTLEELGITVVSE